MDFVDKKTLVLEFGQAKLIVIIVKYLISAAATWIESQIIRIRLRLVSNHINQCLFSLIATVGCQLFETYAGGVRSAERRHGTLRRNVVVGKSRLVVGLHHCY